MTLRDHLSTPSERTLLGALVGVFVLVLAALGAMVALIVILVSGIHNVDDRTAALEQAVVAQGAKAPIQRTLGGVREGIHGLRFGDDASLARVVGGLQGVTRRLERVTSGLDAVRRNTRTIAVLPDLLDALRSVRGEISSLSGHISSLPTQIAGLRDQFAGLRGQISGLRAEIRPVGLLQPVRAILGRVEKHIESIDRKLGVLTLGGALTPGGSG